MASFRRLAKDHAALAAALPPNYLFPDNEDASSLPDDLTQLTVLVTGADGTPYAQGLWRLHLKMPKDYPKSPPTAKFVSKIYHPNVDEKTGAVCLETLKRDWDPKLTLKDILITISCLLIQPNPDSALNAAAGALIQEDYDAFSRQARLMTSIHAPVPKHLQAAVREAKRRGEEVLEEAEPGKAISGISQDDTKENEITKSRNSTASPRHSSQAHMKTKRPLSEVPILDDPEVDGEPEKKSPRTARSEATDSETQPLLRMSVSNPADHGLSQGGRKGTANATRKLPRVGIRRL